ncbi:MAG TPA: hypothetical protein PKC65_05250 [Pyrinomonadaceae bacterium]|nr:hypothetical protein [Pyrinomonadaceae bacterium]
MKLLLLIASIVLFAVNSAAQPKPTSAADYQGAFQYAVSETNAAFPFIFTVIVDEYANGKKISSESIANERQAAGVQRITRTILKDGKKSTSFQVSVGFGKVYCSFDGTSWQGPQKYECGGPTRLYGRRETESAEYSVEDKTLDGEKVNIYREYLIYKPTEVSGKKEFKETFATIDSRGFFITVTNNEGTLEPPVVTLIRKQTWDFKTPLKPVVAPK